MNQFNLVAVSDLSDSQKSDILNLLVLTDYEFIPPLSARNSTTQTNLTNTETHKKEIPLVYYENLLRQNFLLALHQNQVIGFMSYIPNHKIALEDDFLIAHYVSTVIVHPDFRSNGITEAFYDLLAKDSKGTSIATRTWSTNHGHLRILQKKGFLNILTLPNDRGDGIDTVYYCKSI